MAVMRPLLRKNEGSMIPSAFWFCVGAGIVFRWIPTQVAQLAVLMLSIVDPLASTFGVLAHGSRFHYGFTIFGSRRSLVGCVAAAFAALAVWHVYLAQLAAQSVQASAAALPHGSKVCAHELQP